MQRKIRLGLHDLWALQKSMVRKSWTPVVFRAGLIGYLLGQNALDFSPGVEREMHIT